MKKFVSIMIAVFMVAILFAGCKNISDSNDGSIEPPASMAPSQGGNNNDRDDQIGMPTVMPELVPSEKVESPSNQPSNAPSASGTPENSQPPAGGNSSVGGNDTAGNDTAGEGGSAHT